MADEIKKEILETESAGDLADKAESTPTLESAAVTKFRAEMEKRISEAKRKAEERLARSEYEGEYRMKLAALDKRKSKEKQEEEAEREAQIAQKQREEREREIEEYLRREREEAEARSRHAESLFESVGIKEKNYTPPTVAEEEKGEACGTDAALPDIEAAIPKEEIHISELSAEAEKEPEKLPEASTASRDGEKAEPTPYKVTPIFGFVPVNSQKAQIAPKQDIRTKPTQIPAPGYRDVPLQYPVFGMPPMPVQNFVAPYPPRASENMQREFLISERDRAIDEYNEQKMLLEKEEFELLAEEKRRYGDAARDLSAKREDLTLRRERLNAYDDPYSRISSEEGDATVTVVGLDDAGPEISGPKDMYKELKRLHKAENSLLRKREKLIKRVKKSSRSEIIPNLTEELSVCRELVLLSEAEILVVLRCAHKAETKRHRKSLEKYLRIYNDTADKLSTHTGATFGRLSYTVIDELVETRKLTYIPKVNYDGTRVTVFDDETAGYSQDESDFESLLNDYPDADIQTENQRVNRKSMRDEQLRFLRETDAEDERRRAEAEKYIKESDMMSEKDKYADKKNTSLMLEKIGELKKRDELLINARSEYKIAKLVTVRDMAECSFAVKNTDIRQRIRNTERRIDAERNIQRRALRLEREDNDLYYRLLTKKGAEKAVDTGYLDSVEAKLRILLEQRENLNEQLICLYDTFKNNGDGVGSVKVNKVKKKHAKIAYREQKKLASRIGRMKLSDENKEMIFSLMNRKIKIVGNLGATRYKLRKMRPPKPVKKALMREIKRLKSDIRKTNSDISFAMKQAARRDTNYRENKKWGLVLVITALVIFVSLAVWYFAGDAIKDFLSSVFSRF